MCKDDQLESTHISFKREYASWLVKQTRLMGLRLDLIDLFQSLLGIVPHKAFVLKLDQERNGRFRRRSDFSQSIHRIVANVFVPERINECRHGLCRKRTKPTQATHGKLGCQRIASFHDCHETLNGNIKGQGRQPNPIG